MAIEESRRETGGQEEVRGMPCACCPLPISSGPSLPVLLRTGVSAHELQEAGRCSGWAWGTMGTGCGCQGGARTGEGNSRRHRHVCHSWGHSHGLFLWPRTG